jgi:hypothetical protein
VLSHCAATASEEKAKKARRKCFFIETDLDIQDNFKSQTHRGPGFHNQINQ